MSRRERTTVHWGQQGHLAPRHLSATDHLGLDLGIFWSSVLRDDAHGGVACDVDDAGCTWAGRIGCDPVGKRVRYTK